ncbi:unnamed protein product [Nesidiocoris tenuis]|uniref:Uncharacterized protein n=1 Tax=Nesidiocoris tenuis TaxID=355587 RepID=A0A6H5HC99_9HEMI|nr:unnamed protein product [Nesidiocoris tenuis]
MLEFTNIKENVTPVIHVLQYPGCVPKPIPSFACQGRCSSYIQSSYAYFTRPVKKIVNEYKRESYTTCYLTATPRSEIQSCIKQPRYNQICAEEIKIRWKSLQTSRRGRNRLAEHTDTDDRYEGTAQCCQGAAVGLIAPSQQCTCGSQMDVVANNEALDGGEWRCLECSARRSIREGLHVVGGVERDNMKNVFYRVLPENWTIDDLLTALIDHIAYGSVLHNTNPALSDVMGADASRYLDKIWGLKYDTTSNCESPLVTSLWALFEHLIAEKDYTEESLLEFLMRRRMESARDPFLFLLEVIEPRLVAKGVWPAIRRCQVRILPNHRMRKYVNVNEKVVFNRKPTGMEIDRRITKGWIRVATGGTGVAALLQRFPHLFPKPGK